MSWLRTEVGTKVLLVAYNGARFDYPHLTRLLPQFGQADFRDTIVGLADPLLLVRQAFAGKYKKTYVRKKSVGWECTDQPLTEDDNLGWKS